MYKKISIITVTWNRAEMLEDAILSVMSQNYQNYEHIIIDNASTDNTSQILSKYKHIKFISEPDNGQSEAINKGFKLATGEIFGWLNDDDIYLPGTFHFVNENFDTSIYSMIYGRSKIISENKVEIGKTNFHKFKRKELLMGYNNINTPAVFSCLKSIRQVGLADENLFATFDLELWIKITSLKPALPVDRFFSKLRLHPGSGLMSEKKHLKELSLIRKRHFDKSDLHIMDYFIYIYLTIRHFLHRSIKMKYFELRDKYENS